MQEKKTQQVRLTSKEREAMYQLWRKGYTFAQIAKSNGTYRQKPRAVVLSFRPSFQDYRVHDHFRRLKQFRGSEPI
jgi:hypothetical protein